MKSISAIEAKFLRSKILTTSTKLWKDTDITTQNKIIKSVDLTIDESFVLCFFLNDNCWWAITNKQLIISDLDRVRYLLLYSVTKIEPSDILNGKTAKQDIQTLVLKNEQEEIVLKLEKGTWHVIYNIFKFIIGSSND